MSMIKRLKKERDEKVRKKNSLLRLKWDIEEKISQIHKDKSVAQSKNDLSTISRSNLREKKLKNEIYLLKKEIREINNELNYLENLIEQEKVIELNSKFINDKKLSDKEIEELLNVSNDLSDKYHSTIIEYAKFINKLVLSSKKSKNDSFILYLDKIKAMLEHEKGELLDYKNQCIEFEQLDTLKHNLFVANRNLQTYKNDFIRFKIIIKNYNSVVDDYVNFLNSFDNRLPDIDKKFIYSNLKKIRTELQEKISELRDYEFQCLKSNRVDDLNESIDNYQEDLAKIKEDYNKSINLSKKFDNFMEYYMGYFSKFNSKLKEVEEEFWFDDYELLMDEIENKVDSLLYFQNLCVEYGRLDDFSEAITNAKKELVKIKLDFNQNIEKSKVLSNKFYSTIDEYTTFLLKLDSDLKEIEDKFLIDFCNQMIIWVQTKKDDLLDYKEIFAKNKRLNDLNDIIDDATDDLVKIKDTFSKNMNKKLNNMIIEAESIIENKSAIYYQLNLKLSNLIEEVNKLSAYLDKQELLDSLDETRIRLNQDVKNLNFIENQLNNVVRNSMNIQVINAETDKVTDLLNQLSNLNLKNIEKIIVEGEKDYYVLSNLNEDIGSKAVEDSLNELNTLFNRPMFIRQLKRYDLNDKELKTVQNEIRSDIINNVLGEGEDIKKLIKTRCKEFRKTHAGIEEDEINRLLDDIDVEGIDDELIDECKNKVKQDYLEGNISINNVALKFNNCLNKKINESDQLNELEIIKANPNVPKIKVHLTPEETNEIYIITKNEIISEYGIRGSVENHVYYLINQKIRENQSEARGRLNTIKRDFSNLTQLNKEQQGEFVHQIEFYINSNEIKYYDISEEYIVKLSNDFINYGKIRLR